MDKKNEKKNIIKKHPILFAIAVVIVLFIVYKITLSVIIYGVGESYIYNGSYAKARKLYTTLYNLNDDNENVNDLHNISCALDEYYNEKNIDEAREYLDLYENKYDDDDFYIISDEMTKFLQEQCRVIEAPTAEEIAAENKREQEEAEAERKYEAKLKTHKPWEGMMRNDIGRTVLGEPDESNEYFDLGLRMSEVTGSSVGGMSGTMYYWYSGNKCIYAAFSENMYVYSALTKYRSKHIVYVFTPEDDRYNVVKDKTENLQGLGKHRSKKSKSKHDPLYNAEDYANAEDFYEDNYDDFFDYEEAEEWYDEYN